MEFLEETGSYSFEMILSCISSIQCCQIEKPKSIYKIKHINKNLPEYEKQAVNRAHKKGLYLIALQKSKGLKTLLGTGFRCCTIGET